ncbi:MAG: ornithine cyclodeaminase [Streptosporangiaceae bacterium]|jgi:ornithine cyclodeaminase/alanine dehydrogenase-like protein (mu-crystallin family)
MPEPELCVLDRGMIEQCVAAFDPLDVVASVLQSHANSDTVLPAEAYMEWSNRSNAYCRSLAMPGGLLADGEPVYGMKVINAAVSNPAIGLDRAGGIVMLFDPETARPRLLADAGYLSALRTAAYSLLSLRHLGPPVCESASVIGCGYLAKEHLRLLARVHPGISTAHVYDLDPRRAAALAAWAEQHIPTIQVVQCGTARAAVEASTLLFTLTTSQQPYIEPDWFQEGSFVAHVSLDDLTEDVFLGAEAIYVDDVVLVRDNPRRILGRLMTERKIGEPGSPDPGCRITGTLAEVLTGHREAIRPSTGVVVSNPFGMSILDIGLLEKVARGADTAGLGRRLELYGLPRPEHTVGGRDEPVLEER